MKTLIISLLTLLAIASCGLTKEKKKINVTLKFQKHFPYCGGAAPTPEMEKGTYSAQKNTSFYYVNEIGNKEKITTEENGLVSLSLTPGTYKIFAADKKELTLEEFVEKNKPSNEFYKVKSTDCFKDWFLSADFTLVVAENVTATEIITFTERNRCYTKNNPCISYEGPIAP